jgi:hypothetical protein
MQPDFFAVATFAVTTRSYIAIGSLPFLAPTSKVAITQYQNFVVALLQAAKWRTKTHKDTGQLSLVTADKTVCCNV